MLEEVSNVTEEVLVASEIGRLEESGWESVETSKHIKCARNEL
jgi:hypothetical protein